MQANFGDRDDAHALQGESSFKLVQAELKSAHTDTAEVLGQHEVLSIKCWKKLNIKRQLILHWSWLTKFAPLSGTMKEATVTIDMLEELRKLYDKREEKLSTVLQLRRDAAETVTNVAGLIPTKALELATGTQHLCSTGRGLCEICRLGFK